MKKQKRELKIHKYKSLPIEKDKAAFFKRVNAHALANFGVSVEVKKQTLHEFDDEYIPGKFSAHVFYWDYGEKSHKKDS